MTTTTGHDWTADALCAQMQYPDLWYDGGDHETIWDADNKPILARWMASDAFDALAALIESHDHTITTDATRRAVEVIDSLTGDDPEADHGTVDELLLDLVPDQVSEAVARVIRRADWWAGA